MITKAHDLGALRLAALSIRRLLIFLALTAVTFARAAEPTLVLISLDGFRWDYCEKYPDAAPTLRQLKREGVSSRGLIPAFPTNTFPNHYTLVTGLLPAKHGIVNNEFFEPSSGLIFRYNRPESAQAPHWWGGEPIWVTAIKQGRKASTSFWVGSEAEIKGVRPTHWKKYDGSLRAQDRIAEMIGWLDVPDAERPAIAAFYLDETNEAGHRAGPDDPDVAKAVANCDRVVASIMAGLRAKAIEANLVIVSDHGMTATHQDRVVILDDYIDRQKLQIDADGSVVALRPLDGDIEALMRQVQKIPHAKAYRANDLPAHFRLTGNPRIAPVWILPEKGWHVETRASFERLSKRYAPRAYLGGDHGYDPRLRDMHGFFLAHGPAFRRGVELEAVENIHVYNLLCAVLRLKPAPNDGDDRLAKQAMK